MLVWVQQRPPPTGPQNSQTKPIRRALKRKRPINTDLCSVGTVRCVSIIYCKQRGEIHSCPTCRQSVSQSAESGTPRTAAATAANRADSGPNNASVTQVPRGKCGHHNARSEVVFLVGPTLVVHLRSLCQALAPASNSRDGRGDPALRAGKPHACVTTQRNSTVSAPNLVSKVSLGFRICRLCLE